MTHNFQSAGELIFLLGSDVISVVGCGGKTTFIEMLAEEYSDCRVLIAPTTKIYAPCDCVVLDGKKQSLMYFPLVGKQYAGVFNPATNKLCSLSHATIEKLAKRFDLTLLEADGSRGLDCKGWSDYEPSVPDFTTHTIGIITLNCIGKAATNENVLRLPEFLGLCNLNEGEIIEFSALERMVNDEEGMFGKSVGFRSLFINQVEDDEKRESAIKFLQTVRAGAKYEFNIIAYGSARLNQWEEL